MQERKVDPIDQEILSELRASGRKPNRKERLIAAKQLRVGKKARARMDAANGTRGMEALLKLVSEADRPKVKRLMAFETFSGAIVRFLTDCGWTQQPGGVFIREGMTEPVGYWVALGQQVQEVMAELKASQEETTSEGGS